jgi:hypothetical protein
MHWHGEIIQKRKVKDNDWIWVGTVKYKSFSVPVFKDEDGNPVCENRQGACRMAIDCGGPWCLYLEKWLRFDNEYTYIDEGCPIHGDSFGLKHTRCHSDADVVLSSVPRKAKDND